MTTLRRPEPPRTVKLTEAVARKIVDDIVARDLRAGAALATEAEMAAQYAVSRATVREALRMLETNGLVRIRPGRYGGPQVGHADPLAFARSLTWFLQLRRTHFWELLEARVIMEPLMAALAARRRGADAPVELRAAVESHRDLDPEDKAGYLAATQDFHGLIAGISGNGVLDLFGRALKELYTSRAIIEERPAARREEVLAEHERVVEAILAGDAERAEAEMRTHMIALADGFEKQYGTVRDEIVSWW